MSPMHKYEVTSSVKLPSRLIGKECRISCAVATATCQGGASFSTASLTAILVDGLCCQAK